MPFARVALFVVFFCFGILKVFGASPANPLVGALLSTTMPFLDFEQFIVFFGFYEMVIGVSFLIPKMVRVSILLLGLHMVTTLMPLVFLPAIAWTKPLIPTLEGQYIIKNVVIIALAISIVSAMQHPDDMRKAG